MDEGISEDVINVTPTIEAVAVACLRRVLSREGTRLDDRDLRQAQLAVQVLMTLD